jgi:hypothetical protein
MEAFIHATQSKGWNSKVVGCKILGCSPLPPMGDQYSSGSQEI